MGSRTLSVTAVSALLALGAGTVALGSGGGQPATAAKAKPKALFATLNGRNELDPVTLKRGAGDLNGRGSATVLIDGTSVCWGIVVTNLGQPIAAHIHKGTAHRNGPIVVPLSQPATGDPGASSGCTTADASLARDIQRHPLRYYVNVHTDEFPAGAVRGQLHR